MTYEKIKIDRLVSLCELPIESAIFYLEQLANGEGIPYSDTPFSQEPPGVIATIIRRFLCNETIPNALKPRLKLCDGQMEYIAQPCWHEGYDACVSLKKRCQLESKTLQQTGHIEATYRYPSEKSRWYWFLAGWLSACHKT